MKDKRSVLFYCQHLSGTGHFVRSHEIARSLAEAHEVWLVDGGRPVPRSATAGSLRLVSLPRIVRESGNVIPLDSSDRADDVMQERSRKLDDLVRRVRPEVLIIEHFPFSKWELESEIMAMVSACREVRPGCLIIASVRDIVVHSRFDPEPQLYAERVLETLNAVFDGVLVHADPKLTRLDEHLSWMNRIVIPIAYTGIVSEKLGEEAHGANSDEGENGAVVVSGGGADNGQLAELCLGAWRLMVKSNVHPGRELVVFLPPFARPTLTGRLTRLAEGVGACARPFGEGFLALLGRADLSISQAGYNTCANLLETRTRAIVVPNERMSDQTRRARILADSGLVKSFRLKDCNSEVLARAMSEMLTKPKPHHDIDLDGANESTRVVQEWLAMSGPRRRSDVRWSLASLPINNP
jgi:predicted glycosyltransferase